MCLTVVHIVHISFAHTAITSGIESSKHTIVYMQCEFVTSCTTKCKMEATILWYKWQMRQFNGQTNSCQICVIIISVRNYLNGLSISSTLMVSCDIFDRQNTARNFITNIFISNCTHYTVVHSTCHTVQCWLKREYKWLNHMDQCWNSNPNSNFDSIQFQITGMASHIDCQWNSFFFFHWNAFVWSVLSSHLYFNCIFFNRIWYSGG